MKVFVSSLITGYEAYRAAVADAITLLGHQVLRAEDLSASPATPQQACLGLVRDSDVLVLLMGARYGAVQPSGLSATHEEYREARERKPVLVFVEDEVAPEALQAEFLGEVQAWASGRIRRGYRDPGSLKEVVTRALHDHELATSHGAFDEAECMERARSLIPANERGVGGGAELLVAVAAGPYQQVIRPAELDEPTLVVDLQRDALFGDYAVLDPSEGTTVTVRGSRLILKQDSGEVSVDQAGSIRVVKSLRPNPQSRGFEMPSVIQEDVQTLLVRSLRFVASTLDRIDPVRRLSDVVVLANLSGAGWMPWRTRAERDANPTSGQMGSHGDAASTVTLTPSRRHRQALAHDAVRIAEDLTVLLARDRRR